MTQKDKKEVGISNTRQYTKNVENITFEVNKMAKQAKTLTQQEFRRVLDYIATRKHNTRNRALSMTTFLSGVRVG